MTATLCDNGKSLTISIPITLKRPSGRGMIIIPEGSVQAVLQPEAVNDDKIMKAFSKAHRWKKMLEEGKFSSIHDLAITEKVHHSYCARILQLTLVAPDIAASIMNGKQPRGLLLADFMTPFPDLWEEQRKRWGV